MEQLKHKIQNTNLFSDEDKIAILVAIDTYEESDRTKLEAIIDEFDAAQKTAVSEYKKSVDMVLNSVVEKAKPLDKKRFQSAAGSIRQGVDTLLQ